MGTVNEGPLIGRLQKAEMAVLGAAQIGTPVSRLSTLEEALGLDDVKTGVSTVTLPEGKKYAYFLSHKKRHSKLGSISEVRVK